MIQEEIRTQIENYDTIIIHRHQRPDPDAIGSQVGLRNILRANYPEKNVLATGFEEPTLTWMASMDEVSDAFYQSALVIVCDTANTPRIDDDRYSSGDFLLKIDHHPNDDAYGDLYWVNTAASSTSEMIAELSYQLGWTVPSEAARLLYAGIVGDTGRFLYPSTSSRTLELAAQLRKADFDFAALGRQMDSFPYKIAKLQGYIFDHLEVDENGAARVLLTRSFLDSQGLTDAETSAIVSTPGKIDTISCWGIFVEQEPGRYRVRLRSKTHPINEIAKRHEGGGHPLASGANSYSLEENDQIYHELQEVAKKT